MRHLVSVLICLAALGLTSCGKASEHGASAQEPVTPKVAVSSARNPDCLGLKTCSANCRPFGPDNQLCNTYCVATGDQMNNCQTALGCPLPCKASQKLSTPPPVGGLKAPS